MRNRNIKAIVVNGLAWKFGERITGQLVNLVVSIILARMLSPSDYGVVALVMVFITIANVFVSNGLGSALVQKKDANSLDFSSVFYFNVGLSIALYVLIFAISPFLGDFFNQPILVPALRVLGIMIIVAAVNSVQQAYVSRKMLFKKFFWSTLWGTIVSGVIGIAMAYYGFGVWALIAQYLINALVDTIIIWFTVRWRPMLSFSWIRTKPLVGYGWKLLLSALLNAVYSQIRTVVIGKKYSAEDLAFYNQADRYPSVFVSNINNTISSVLFPVMSQAQKDKVKLKQIMRRSIQVSTYLMWPIMLWLLVAACPLVEVLLTERWLPCVPFIQIFCISYAFWPIHTANLQAINALGRSDVFLKLEVIKKMIGIFFLIVSIPFGPLAIAYSMFAVSAVSTVINAYPNVNLLEYSIAQQFRDIAPPLIVSCITVCLIWPISFVINDDVILLFLQFFGGGIIYWMLSALFRLTGWTYLINYYKGK